jgi:hypothetical protein
MGEVIELKKNQKIRCYIIADDYRWHILTDSILEYEEATKAYLALMSKSSKENTYYFKNIFMTVEEFNSTKLLMNKVEPKKIRPKRHLELVID